jgi:polysaccharide biosynthesis/export protein
MSGDTPLKRYPQPSVFVNICLAILVGACSGGGPAVRADSPAVSAESAESPGQADYVIGTGDVIRIVVVRNPDLTVEVPVRPDGRVSTPLVNDIVAVGKTPTALSKDLEKALGEFVRSPTVSVIVVQPTSRFSQVRVVGQGVNPRAVPYRNGMTVLDLVIEVGGLSQFAAGNRAKIIRTDRTGTHEIPVKLNDLLNKGRVVENVALQPGDVLFIPESFF